MGIAVANRGSAAMSYHAVLAFPDDKGETLERVLTRTKTAGIISSPMEDLLLICSSETDAVFIRCGLALRTASMTTLLVPLQDQPAVNLWLRQNGMAGRCEWAALEHLEFFSETAVDRTIEVFSSIVGHDPQSLPLNLWPDVFRSNLRAV